MQTKCCSSLSLNRVQMLWDIISVRCQCSFVSRILQRIWHFVELFFTTLSCTRRLCLRTGAIRYGQQVGPRHTEVRRVCKKPAPPLPVSDVVAIPWLLLISGTECCVSLMKLSRAALGRGWVHSSLGCEKWPVYGKQVEPYVRKFIPC